MRPILLVLCALFLTVASTAQIPLDSFYKDNTRWINFVDYTQRDHLSPTGTNKGSIVLEYRILGDSIINNISFKKLYVRRLYHIIDAWTTPTYKSQSVYVGRLRIDGRKLYYTNDSSLQSCYYDKSGMRNKIGDESLVADWGLNIGDTFNVNSSRQRIVKDIYSQTLPSGQTINAYVMCNYYNTVIDTLLEGIGNSSIPFSAYCSVPDELWTVISFSSSNLCFLSDGFYYHSDAKSKYLNWYLMQNCFDESKLTVSNTNTTDNNFSIVPNPNNGHFSIKGFSGAAQTSIHIYNNIGQRVFDKTITGQDINTEILLNNSAPGIYTINICSGDFVKHEKLIIQ